MHEDRDGLEVDGEEMGLEVDVAGAGGGVGGMGVEGAEEGGEEGTV